MAAHAAVRPRGREEGRADPRPAGDLQRAVLLPVAGSALVRRRRARARARRPRRSRRSRRSTGWRSSCPSTSARTPGVYYNTAAVYDSRRDVPRQVPQEPHPAHVGLLGEVLLQARQPRLSRLPDALREGRRLHLLRPALPRGRARSRAERRRDRLQPVRDGRGPLAVPLEARAAGARGRERLLRRGEQPRRDRGAVEHRAFLRLVVRRRPARQLPRDRERGQGRASSSRPATST